MPDERDRRDAPPWLAQVRAELAKEPKKSSRLASWTARFLMLIPVYVAGLFCVTVFMTRDAGTASTVSTALFRAIYQPVLYDVAPNRVLEAWYWGAVRMCLASSECRVTDDGIYVNSRPLGG